MSDEFDRIRPPRDRLLHRGDAGELTDPTDGERGQGRQALFSAGRHGDDPTGVALRCSRCGNTSALDLRSALKAALPLVLVAPWRAEPFFARCPACDRRSWLAVETDA